MVDRIFERNTLIHYLEQNFLCWFEGVTWNTHMYKEKLFIILNHIEDSDITKLSDDWELSVCFLWAYIPVKLLTSQRTSELFTTIDFELNWEKRSTKVHTIPEYKKRDKLETGRQRAIMELLKKEYAVEIEFLNKIELDENGEASIKWRNRKIIFKYTEQTKNWSVVKYDDDELLIAAIEIRRSKK